MIEIVQHTEKNAEGKLPKNIRQIGNPEKDFRIYMEDYVYTYLHPAQIYTVADCQGSVAFGAQEEIFPRLLALVGEINHFSNRSCAFICGAIEVEYDPFSEAMPELNDDTLRLIHKELQRFFGKSEVVGWALDLPGNALEITPEMEAVHRSHFISPYQFFFLMDSREREEAFYVWRGGRLSRKEGYFIYYEKNPGMQEYLISKRESAFGEASPTERNEDRAAQNYRAMMLEKKEKNEKQGTGLLSYLTSILMVLVLCTVSVLLLGNIRQMEQMEQTISVMSNAMETTEQEKENVKNQVPVETVSGNVLPLEEPKEEVAAALAQFSGESGVQKEPQAEETDPIVPPQEEPEVKEPESGSETAQKPETDDEAGQQPPDQEGQPQETDEGQEAPPAQTEGEQYQTQGYYIVQQGDSLRQICYKIYQDYAMITPLCEANAITDQDYIYVGQRLALP